MPRVIAIANFKGGIGKTTTTINVAAGFALKGAKVLVVDVDAQNNVQMAFGMPAPRRSLYDVLVENAKVTDCVANARPNLDVLVAGESLLMGQTELSRRNDWGRVLEMALKPAAREYDFVFIDCSASVTVLNWNALMAATDIVVPTALEHLAMQGLSQISRSITRVKGSLTAMRAIVPTMYDTRNRLANELLASLRAAHGKLVTEPIRVNVRLAESPAHGKTIYEYDPRSRGAADYAALVEHLGTLFNFKPAPPQPAAAPAPASPAANGHARPAVGNGLGPYAPATPVPVTPVPAEPASFTGGMRERCPHCQRPLEQVMMAGYRVLYCDYCKYKRQELASGVRR